MKISSQGLHYVTAHAILLLQEKIGEVTGKEDQWPGRDDQPTRNKGQETGHTEPEQSGH